MSRAANKAKAQRARMGHPASVARRRRKQASLDSLTKFDRERELERRRLVRMLSEELSFNPQEGALVGPLAAAARRAAEVLCERLPGLEGHEHVEGVTNYLTERLGDVLDGFSVVDYRDWRQGCLSNVQRSPER